MRKGYHPVASAIEWLLLVTFCAFALLILFAVTYRRPAPMVWNGEECVQWKLSGHRLMRWECLETRKVTPRDEPLLSPDRR